MFIFADSVFVSNTTNFRRTHPPSTLSPSDMIGDIKSDFEVKLPTFPSGLKYRTSKLIVA